jgi:hypothetical protein
MIGEHSRQLIVRHRKGRVWPRKGVFPVEAVDLKMKKSPLKTSTIPGPQTPDQSLLLYLHCHRPDPLCNHGGQLSREA